MSWERLNLLAEAHERRHARIMMQKMIAAQGDEKSWTALMNWLKKMLK
jgi:hypothetical protein